MRLIRCLRKSQKTRPDVDDPESPKAAGRMIA
jgi:hypothetical protein